MAGITGLGSGIEIDKMVNALVAAEQQPKQNQLDKLEKSTTTTISAIGNLTGAINTFKSAVDALNKPSLFEARTATSSNTSQLKVTADTTAPAGSYSVQVQQLAAGSKVALQSVSGTSAATFNTGSFKISAGTTSLDIDVTSSNNSLAGIRDAINTAGKDKGISATIVTDASGSRLILSSTNSGAGKDIQVSGVSENGLATGSNSLSTLAFAPVEDPANPGTFIKPSSTSGAGGVIEQAKSAKLTIDGLYLERDSNTIKDDALEGITLDLVAAQSSADLTDGKAINVTVGVDKAGVKNNLQKFVEAYNALISTTSQLTAVVPVEGSDPVTGPLLGDSSIRNLLSGLRNQMVQMTSGTGVRALADLGITTQKDGTLALDDTKLTSTLDKNFDQVASYLTGSDGLMGRMSGLSSTYVAEGGVLKQRSSALSGTLKDIDSQRKSLAERIDKLQTRLYAQYNAMDTLVGQLSRTSESLTSQLANLPGFVKKSS